MTETATSQQMTEKQRIRHEINNVLAGIIGHTQLLRLRGEMDMKSRERIDKIEELAGRIGDLAKQIRD